MTTALKALEIAGREIGYSRYDDPNEGTKYGRWYAHRTKSPYFGTTGVPYCAMGVSWVLSAIGASLFGDGMVYAYVPWMERDAKAKGRAKGFYDIQPGDVLCFDWDDDEISDHTGFAVRRQGEYVHTIEFNTSPGAGGSQSNGGGVYRRVRHRSTVRTVIRPAYDTNTSAEFRDIRALQAAVRAVVDNVAGPDTRKRTDAVRCASTWGGTRFPYGVPYTQRVVGTDPDGIWGEHSMERHDTTVGDIQRAVGVLADEYWGSITEAAVAAALDGAEQP